MCTIFFYYPERSINISTGKVFYVVCVCEYVRMCVCTRDRVSIQLVLAEVEHDAR